MGRILLYSDFRPGISTKVDDVLLRLLEGTPCRMGYIPSESDTKRRYFDKVRDRYSEIGIMDVTYFDLGDEFTKDNIPDLMSSDAIHLSGGDPVRFLELVRQRNFHEHLKAFLKKGGILTGISAGAMILTQSLGLIDMEAGRPYSKPKSALKLVDFEFYPHFKQDDKTAKALSHYARARKTRVYGCDDNGGILIENGVVTTLGQVTSFDPG